VTVDGDLLGESIQMGPGLQTWELSGPALIEAEWLAFHSNSAVLGVFIGDRAGLKEEKENDWGRDGSRDPLDGF
jgi:hypothetical protein